MSSTSIAKNFSGKPVVSFGGIQGLYAKLFGIGGAIGLFLLGLVFVAPILLSAQFNQDTAFFLVLGGIFWLIALALAFLPGSRRIKFYPDGIVIQYIARTQIRWQDIAWIKVAVINHYRESMVFGRTKNPIRRDIRCTIGLRNGKEYYFEGMKAGIAKEEITKALQLMKANLAKQPNVRVYPLESIDLIRLRVL